MAVEALQLLLDERPPELAFVAAWVMHDRHGARVERELYESRGIAKGEVLGEARGKAEGKAEGTLLGEMRALLATLSA